MKCGAVTKKGAPCENGLGCPHHKEHCREVINTRAELRVIPPIPPVQGELFPLSWEDVMRIVRSAYIAEKASHKKGGCGCTG